MQLPEATVLLRGQRRRTGLRELELLKPDKMVSRVDAALLTGGSAFGLAGADGVVGIEEIGRGFATAAGPVPIVPSLALYDLGSGSPGSGRGLSTATLRPRPRGERRCFRAG